MSCFDNYIAIEGGCTVDTLDSGGFMLNDVGITREFVESVISSDFLDVDDFVTKKVRLAVRKLQTDLFAHLSGKFNTKSIIEGARVGYYQDNMILNPAIAGTLKGLQLQLFESFSYLNIFVSKIQLQVDFTGNVSVLVYDLKQNKLLDTLVVSCTAGQISSLVVNKVYASESEWANIAFLYNGSTFGSYRSSTVEAGCSGCYKYYPFRLNKYVLGSGVTILSADPKIQENIDGYSDTGGLSIQYSLQCSQEAWLCSNANLLAPALLYKTAELMTFHARYYSEQLNSIIFDSEKLEERIKAYEHQYNSEMDAVLNNLRIPQDSVCFFCNNSRVSKTILPA